MLPEPKNAEATRAIERIRNLCARFPERRACSEDERGAQQAIADALNDVQNLEVRWEKFRWNLSLYSVMALHFGIATVGALIAPKLPWLGMLMLLLAGLSYWADASRTANVLRGFMPKGNSQNLVTTLPAKGERKLRVVLLAHVDAAFTGFIFTPKMLKRAGGGRTGERQPYTARSLEMTIDAVFLLAILAFGRGLGWVDGPWIRALELLLTIAPFLACAINLEVVWRDKIVPGAADNLSGVACCEAIIRRFTQAPVENVELVTVFTGCEEAGTGGAWCLARDHVDDWSVDDTVIIGVDTVSNGELRWFVEGEMDRVPVAPWLENALRRTAASDNAFDGVRPFQIPVGATDAMPFLARGYSAVTVGCTDVEYGAPRHYHHPTDVPDNVAPEEISLATDFVEALIRQVAEAKLK